MTVENDILNPEQKDVEFDNLRPSALSEFIGQGGLKENLNVFIQASKMRDKAIDHILFYGPPGLGKTTLSSIISKEMNVGFRLISGPMLTKTGDLAAILTNLQPKDVLFIDEIHRLSASIEESLYSAMEDFRLDIIIGEGPAARTIKIELPRFTLIGATTKLGSISAPLRGRFGIPMKLEFYTVDELSKIVMRDALLIGVSISDKAAQVIAIRSRGTPRIAIRMLKRVADFAFFNKSSEISEEMAIETLKKLGVDDYGLDRGDRDYLQFMADNYINKPAGLQTISAGITQDSVTIEDTIEPYLIQIGFIEKTPRGRLITAKALHFLGINF